MFDFFDTSKLLIIGVVALMVIPPKDLPSVLRQLGQTVGKLRRMANEFQNQFNDALREADLDSLKKEINDLQSSAAMPLDIGTAVPDITTPAVQGVETASSASAMSTLPDNVAAPHPVPGAPEALQPQTDPAPAEKPKRRRAKASDAAPADAEPAAAAATPKKPKPRKSPVRAASAKVKTAGSEETNV